MSEKALKPGDTVLVAGGTGFVGSVICRSLLSAGFHVRAATRSAAKAEAFRIHLSKHYKDVHFDLVEVRDFAAPNAYDEALQGCSGFIITAADVSMIPDTQAIVDNTTRAVGNILASAARAPQLRRVVMTSDRTAAFFPEEDSIATITPTSWNDAMIEIARELAADNADKAFFNYYAGKVAGERKAWDFVKKHNPTFAFSTILPDAPILGNTANPESHSTGGWLIEFFEGKIDSDIVPFFKYPSTVVHVEDVARLHIAALIEPDVTGERLFAVAEAVTINDILGLWRRIFPERHFPPDFQGVYAKRSRLTIETGRSMELLRRQKRSGFIDWETCVMDTLASKVSMPSSV